MRGMCLLVLSLPILGCGAPRPVQEPVDECPITLTAKTPGSLLRPVSLAGTCPLSDGVILRIQLYRRSNRILEDRLGEGETSDGATLVQLERHEFSWDFRAAQSGRYTALLWIPPEVQEKEHLDELSRKAVGNRQWRFTFDVTVEGGLLRAGKKLEEVGPLVKSVSEYVDAYEAALGSEERWQQEKIALMATGGDLDGKISSSGLKDLYPAAVGELSYMVRHLERNVDLCHFEEGKFVGIRQARGQYGQPLSYGRAAADRYDSSFWKDFRRCLREYPTIAAQEFLLGVLSSRRASNGHPSPDEEAALEAAKNCPGVARWAARVKSAAPGEDPALEAELRKIQDPSPR